MPKQLFLKSTFCNHFGRDGMGLSRMGLGGWKQLIPVAVIAEIYRNSLRGIISCNLIRIGRTTVTVMKINSKDPRKLQLQLGSRKGI